MSVADWRALLEALLDSRLSPQAFARRFMEAMRDAKTRGEPAPPAIRDMAAAVEAFEAESSDRDEFSVNSDEIENAARRALSALGDSARDPAIGPRTFDRARTREDMRRFTMRVSGCAGFGCVIALAWVVLCLVQIIFVSEWVQHTLGWSAWPSAFLGFLLAFTPIIGNVLAFLDATQSRDWPPLVAALVFFAAPAATMISGWMRWRRFR